jgi:hypothetical protein
MPNDIRDIAEAILRNRTTTDYNIRGCTPFVGAGVSKSVCEKLDANALTDALVQQFEVPHWVSKDLPTVADYVAADNHHSQMPAKLHIRKVITDLTSLATAEMESTGWEALTDFVRCPFPLIITTNYDNFIEEAAIKAGKDVVRVVCNWFDGTKDAFKQAKMEECPPDLNTLVGTNKVVVFHIHGHVDLPESLVLSQDDYVKFLVQFSKQSKETESNMIPPPLHTVLACHSLLLLGYSMEDVNFKVLIRAIREIERKSILNKSLSIQTPPTRPNLCRQISELCNSECMDGNSIRQDITLKDGCISRMREQVFAEWDLDKQKESEMSCLQKMFDDYSVSIVWNKFHVFVEKLINEQQMKDYFASQKKGGN